MLIRLSVSGVTYLLALGGGDKDEGRDTRTVKAGTGRERRDTCVLQCQGEEKNLKWIESNGGEEERGRGRGEEYKRRTWPTF